uniref:Uncharacterized protein n=1 Tax=Anguilla anguilla TaxID=7936 RepID=A0A0E9UWI3_ANGAN
MELFMGTELFITAFKNWHRNRKYTVFV